MAGKKKKSVPFLNSKGMTSIVMVMVAAVITGIVALTAGRTLIDLKKIFIGAETELDIALSVQDFQRVLGKSADCTASLSTAGALSTSVPRTLPRIVNSTVTNVCGALPCNIAVGLTDSNNKYRISRMVVEEYAPNPAGCDIGRPSEKCSTPVLNISLEKIGVTSKITPTLMRSIPLEVRTNAANRVTFCFAMLDREFLSTDKFVNESGDTMTGALNITLPAATPPSRGLYVNNAYIQTSAFYIDSDRRLKQNIHKIQNPLALLAKLEGKEFLWKNTGEKDFGFIAQDVEALLPELVHTNAETTLKSLKYTSLIPLVIEAIKEMEAENQTLHARLAFLEQSILEIENSCLQPKPTVKE